MTYSDYLDAVDDIIEYTETQADETADLYAEIQKRREELENGS